MTILKNKWIILLLVILLVSVLLAVFSKKSVRTELFIPAEASSIWSVLMDTTDYKHWNPALIPLTGPLQLGKTIQYQWTPPNGEPIKIDSTVIEMIESQFLHQRGGTPGILTFDHRYELFPTKGGTQVVQSEVYRGIGVWFWNAKQMGPQYSKVNQALLDKVTGNSQ